MSGTTSVKQQGIVSILGSECDQTTAAASLRRTLSADMSSKKWFAQNGFSFSLSPMKKIASSEHLAIKYQDSSSFYEEEEEVEDDEEKEMIERPGQDEVWRSIQSQKKQEVERPGQLDIWSSILTNKSKEDEQDKSSLPPPYVHPLVKKSSSSLNHESLEICTESLGSETGSDGFSSYAPSESGDVEEDKEETQPQPQPQPLPLPPPEKVWESFEREEFPIVKYDNYSTTKKSPPKSFPPPLPSLSYGDGASLHMQPRRVDGRLVLEAVSVPSQNCFHAHRQDGRLFLTFSNTPALEDELDGEELIDQDVEVDETEEEVFNNFVEGKGQDYETEKEQESEEEDDEDGGEFEDKIEIENGAKDIGIVMEQAPNLSSGVINVHRSALVIKKLLGLSNRDPTAWNDKMKKTVTFVDHMEEADHEDPFPQLSQSLPRPPRVAHLMASPPVTPAASSFNAYEYFLRPKPAVTTVTNPITQQLPLTNNNCHKGILSNSAPKEDMVLLRGSKADYLVPMMKGCKVAKRSLLIWEPCCIATS